MRLDQWAAEQSEYFGSKTHYARKVDNVFLQICKCVDRSIIRGGFELNRRLKLSDFSIDSSGRVQFSKGIENIAHKSSGGVYDLKQSGLGEILYGLLYGHAFEKEFLECESEAYLYYASKSRITGLDLEPEFQGFDVIIELLTGYDKSPVEFFDFPVSSCKVFFLNEENGEVLDEKMVILEELDDRYILPDSIVVDGKVYNSVQQEVINYSFLNRSYSILYRRSKNYYPNDLHVWDDIGIVGIDRSGHRRFIPFKTVNKKSKTIIAERIPAPCAPYITIVPVIRENGYQGDNIDEAPEKFQLNRELLVSMPDWNIYFIKIELFLEENSHQVNFGIELLDIGMEAITSLAESGLMYC